jgi:hypothetical protein
MRWLALRAVVCVAALVGSLALVATPASAYSPNPKFNWIEQDAGTCASIDEHIGADVGAGYFEAWKEGGRCWLDSADFGNQSFALDPDSRNLMVELYIGTEPIGVITFQAAGEYVDIFDLVDDSDTFYFWVSHAGPWCACPGGPGIDFNEVDFTMPEGESFNIEITDDAAGTDVIAATGVPMLYVPPLIA